MDKFVSSPHQHGRFYLRSSVAHFQSRIAIFLFILLLPLCSLVGAPAEKLPVAFKWGRFEQSFKSTVNYSNPPQEAALTVAFTSPLGETFTTDGFWDGGKVWRVRFSPNQPGRWSFKTTCSDAANIGLHNQTGQFICTANPGTTPFDQHGPVRVAADHRHFEHVDGTPFFWLADTVWQGARMSLPKDWQLYAQVRSSQQFSVAQWAVAPGEDNRGQSAFGGPPERIVINPDFFKRLDAKLETLSHAGLLNAVAPFLEIGSSKSAASALSDDQLGLLFRYMVARWNAEPVAWLLAPGNDPTKGRAAHWNKIGQTVFAEKQHAPVILYAGNSPEVMDEFRDQAWVDAFGCQIATDISEDALKRTLAAPLAVESKKLPIRPFITFTPVENGITPQSSRRFAPEDVRRSAYWGLLMASPAGVSYAGEGVADWNSAVEPKTNKNKGADLPAWHKALFMPGAKQMSYLAKFIETIDYWRLRPLPDFVATQPGNLAPSRYVSAAGTDTKNLAVVYVPQDRTLEVVTDTIPASPAVTWFNPRTGENTLAVAVVASRTCQFPTPDPGDWFLVIKSGK
jgi:hypothetical protein